MRKRSAWMSLPPLPLVSFFLLLLMSFAPLQKAAAQEATEDAAQVDPADGADSLASPAAVTELLSLTVNAGFDGYFRDNNWMPLFVRVSNDGDDVTGRLTVRPERTGSGVPNTFSTPIDMPNGARKTAFLYITARSFAQRILVEFINDQDQVISSQSVAVTPILPQDQLYVVVTNAASGSVDLSGAHVGGYDAYQAIWTIDNIPDHAAALDAVTLLAFSDVDTGSLTSAQHQAIADWVARGGHLLVTGGPNWQATAAGLTDLLPMTPDNSATADNLTELANWLRIDPSQGNLDEAAVIATGALLPDAQVLVEVGGETGVGLGSGDSESDPASSEPTPLLIRGLIGEGVVDYLTADPLTAPLRGWSGMDDLWFSLLTSVGPQPSWSYGLLNTSRATEATDILPGYDLLPDVLPLCGFLAAYIALVGPLNYVILNRINRREWAWLTIPVFIVIFSVLAYVVGSNLRGNEVTLNRLALVQTWPDTERAQVDELIGLLSPRRSSYTLSLTDDGLLRPIMRENVGGSLFNNNAQSSTDIRQTDFFSAFNFSVDASFIASFSAQSSIERPEVGGQANVFYDEVKGQQVARGAVRNDSDVTLIDPVIMGRGMTLRLSDALEAGDVETFELTFSGEGPPAPSPVEYAPNMISSLSSFALSYQANVSEQTIIDIVGEENYNIYGYNQRRYQDLPLEQLEAAQQRQSFLEAFMADFYMSTGRANRVYLAGWVESTPLEMELQGAVWNTVDLTLYLVELDVTRTLPAPGEDVTISSDQFTWVVQERTGLSDLGPVNLRMQADEQVVFRFTPVPGAILDDVNELTVRLSRTNSVGREVPIELWNWRSASWEELPSRTSGQTVRSPERFLGPQNAVQIRLAAESFGGYLQIDELSVEQRGTFAAEEEEV
ncbi:MAG: hypothetical protein H7175_25630 [Burkholderiales bacterium]|nr:hypothetical protein [Anaerolineae bacterium]